MGRETSHHPGRAAAAVAALIEGQGGQGAPLVPKRSRTMWMIRPKRWCRPDGRSRIL